MTGYGKAAGEFKGKIISAEIKSLNSKFFELTMRLPSAYREKDIEMRSTVSKIADRGKVDVSITIEHGPGAALNTLNKEVIKSYYNELKNIQLELKADNSDLLDAIMHLPLVLNTDKGIADEEEWTFIQSLLNNSLSAFNEFRSSEGKTLEKELSDRLGNVEQRLKDIEKFEKNRMENVRMKMHKTLETFLDEASVDKNRFEQELIYYIEKLDITEEKVRLLSHLNYFRETMKANDNSGKKLGFISQEIGREINTIGSKANDADIQRLVVEMKDEAEKIREQLANVL